MDDWRTRLRADPLPWLLDASNPAVRHLALRDLLDRPADDPEVVDARNAATRTDPIASILAAQDPAGWWEKPGPGYATKYRGTVWQLIFLDQLGADPAEPRVRAACEYVLAHTQAPTGGFGASGVAARGTAAALERHPLPQREPAARAHRVRLARRRARRPGDRVGDRHRHGRGRPALQRDHPGTGLPLRRERRASLRVGGHEGAPRARPDPAGPALSRDFAGDRAGGRPAPWPRPGGRGLPDGLREHAAERLVVPASASRRATSPTCSRSSRRSARPGSGTIRGWPTRSTSCSRARTITAAGPTTTPMPAR